MKCRYCRSKKVVKAGFQYTKEGRKQRYQCQECHRHTVKRGGKE